MTEGEDDTSRATICATIRLRATESVMLSRIVQPSRTMRDIDAAGSFADVHDKELCGIARSRR